MRAFESHSSQVKIYVSFFKSHLDEFIDTRIGHSIESTETAENQKKKKSKKKKKKGMRFQFFLATLKQYRFAVHAMMLSSVSLLKMMNPIDMNGLLGSAGASTNC
jgi:hypothetical protein